MQRAARRRHAAVQVWILGSSGGEPRCRGQRAALRGQLPRQLRPRRRQGYRAAFQPSADWPALERFARDATGADELIITTITHQHADRVRSYELLAEEWARR